MSQHVSKLLKRRTDGGKAIVTGKRANRGAGYGLESPCNYIFYGDNDEKIGRTGVFLREIGSSSADSYHIL